VRAGPSCRLLGRVPPARRGARRRSRASVPPGRGAAHTVVATSANDGSGAGLLQDGLEHLRDEALLGARQSLEHLELNLELGAGSALGLGAGEPEQMVDRDVEERGESGQQRDGDPSPSFLEGEQLLLGDPEGVGDLDLSEPPLRAQACEALTELQEEVLVIAWHHSVRVWGAGRSRSVDAGGELLEPVLGLDGVEDVQQTSLIVVAEIVDGEHTLSESAERSA
jgi:hypothetical protein